MNTFTVSTAVTPTVVSTFLSHYLNRERLRKRPTAHLSYDEGLHLVKSFLDFASQHTVEDLQAFTAQWVPHPQWVRVEEIEIPQEKLDEAAAVLQEQLGPDGIRQVGGRKWWQWRKSGKPLKAEWIEMKADHHERKYSSDPTCRRAMLYVHGGAYYFGSVDEHRYQLQRHARKLKARVLAPEYRLAPQFPFPCGLQDCIAAYMYLLTVQDPTTIILAGDSAGGGMVLSLLVTLRDRGLPLPAGAILISPWVDLTHSFPSVSADCPLDYIPPNGFHHKPSKAWPPLNADEYALLKEEAANQTKPDQVKLMKPASVEMKRLSQGISRSGEKSLEEVPVTPPLSIEIDGKEVKLKEQIQMYTTNELLAHPLVSPVMQPTLGGLPPLLIMTGGGEFLRDEQIYLAHKCANPTKYPVAESLMHESAREQLARFKPTDVQLQVWDDLCHVAPTLSFTRPAKFMYRSIAQFGAWALARAQHTEIEILDDDDISVISSSEESDAEKQGPTLRVKSTETDVHPTIGKAGDPLPSFKNHMIRQRVSRHGVITPLEPASDLPACNMHPEDIGVVKVGPVRKWLEARRQWDNRFGSAAAKVRKQRLRAMVAGYDGFDGETPPPSALAGRRKIAAEDKERKRKKSMGMSLWSLWGSKHDKATVIREQEADKVPETKVATAEEGEGARSQSELKKQSKKVAQKELAKTRSRSRRKVVRDDRQTATDDSSVDENTPAAVLLTKKEEKQKQAEAEAEDEPAPGPGPELEHDPSRSGQITPEPETGVTGKRPFVGGIAAPFSLNREAETASMITLTSELPSRVASPIPTTPRTSTLSMRLGEGAASPLSERDRDPLAAVMPGTVSPETIRAEADGATEEGSKTPGPTGGVDDDGVAKGKVGGACGQEAAPAIVVGDAGAQRARPPLETFVTARENLPRAD
ncbi:hypothetical protein DL767_011524 [Monosporascus sp. MG133]|nr:hypothetical protein DL767_011524 [Monosporascus sp. MG133]